jgi:hypothetical protein
MESTLDNIRKDAEERIVEMKILARTIRKSEADNQRRGSDHHDYS